MVSYWDICKEEIKKLATECLKKWNNDDSIINRPCCFCVNSLCRMDIRQWNLFAKCNSCYLPDYLCNIVKNNTLHYIAATKGNRCVSSIKNTKIHKYILLVLKELEKDGEISRETETKIIKYIDSQRVWTNG